MNTATRIAVDNLFRQAARNANAPQEAPPEQQVAQSQGPANDGVTNVVYAAGIGMAAIVALLLVGVIVVICLPAFTDWVGKK
jgi:hypothetical protein